MNENDSDSPNSYEVSSEEHSTLANQSNSLAYDAATCLVGAVALFAMEAVLIWSARGRYSSLDASLLRLNAFSIMYLVIGIATVLSLRKFKYISLVCSILLTSLVLLITLANFAISQILSGPLV